MLIFTLIVAVVDGLITYCAWPSHDALLSTTLLV